MLEPVNDAPDREEWDEQDWERFLRRADARTAKYQELFETLARDPHRDQLIAHEMGWEADIRECGGDARKCPDCARRFDCEAFEMLRLMSAPVAIEEDPDAEELIACFEQLREVPAYTTAQDFASQLEDRLGARQPPWTEDEDMRAAIFAAQMVPAQVAGGHGIGYERDSLCGNIANCKRARGSLELCLDHLNMLHGRGILQQDELHSLRHRGEQVAREISRWIENLRGRIWWR